MWYLWLADYDCQIQRSELVKMNYVTKEVWLVLETDYNYELKRLNYYLFNGVSALADKAAMYIGGLYRDP